MMPIVGSCLGLIKIPFAYQTNYFVFCEQPGVIGRTPLICSDALNAVLEMTYKLRWSDFGIAINGQAEHTLDWWITIFLFTFWTKNS